MRYKIILSNSKETITIREDELNKVLQGINQGSVIIVREGIFNPSYFVAMVLDTERTRLLAEAKNQKYKLEEPSPFVKLLGKKMPQLSGEKEGLRLKG